LSSKAIYLLRSNFFVKNRVELDQIDFGRKLELSQQVCCVCFRKIEFSRIEPAEPETALSQSILFLPPLLLVSISIILRHFSMISIWSACLSLSTPPFLPPLLLWLRAVSGSAGSIRLNSILRKQTQQNCRLNELENPLQC